MIAVISRVLRKTAAEDVEPEAAAFERLWKKLF
jgi:hypothetical protein